MRVLLQSAIATVLWAGCAAPKPIATPKPEIPIWAAAEAGNREFVLRHLAAGTDTDTRDERYGATSLHWAAWCGHLNIVELILAARSNVNAVNFGGETPLDCAKKFSQDEITTLLRRHGGRTAAELKTQTKK